MKIRINDTKATKEFATAGVTLHAETLNVNGFEFHYAEAE